MYTRWRDSHRVCGRLLIQCKSVELQACSLLVNSCCPLMKSNTWKLEHVIFQKWRTCMFSQLRKHDFCTRSPVLQVDGHRYYKYISRANLFSNLLLVHVVLYPGVLWERWRSIVWAHAWELRVRWRRVMWRQSSHAALHATSARYRWRYGSGRAMNESRHVEPAANPSTTATVAE